MAVTEQIMVLVSLRTTTEDLKYGQIQESRILETMRNLLRLLLTR